EIVAPRAACYCNHKDENDESLQHIYGRCIAITRLAIHSKRENLVRREFYADVPPIKIGMHNPAFHQPVKAGSGVSLHLGGGIFVRKKKVDRPHQDKKTALDPANDLSFANQSD